MAKDLNDIMQFDHVVMVAEDGTITDRLDIYCDAELNVMTNGEDDFYLPTGWELLKGFTGQYGYNGPVMHSSEYVGGGLERHIRETPGYYVVLIVYASCNYEKHTPLGYGAFPGSRECSCGATCCEEPSTDCTEDSGCDCEPAGWAIAYKPLETEGE